MTEKLAREIEKAIYEQYIELPTAEMTVEELSCWLDGYKASLDAVIKLLHAKAALNGD